jgi:hypothetical protein
METDMTGKIPKLVGAMLAASAVFALAAGSASAATIYNYLPKPMPGNVVSQGFEANALSSFGGQVGFAGTKRTDPSVTVVMSSWGCQEGSWTDDTCKTTGGATFNQPITLNVYNVGAGNSLGTPVTSATQTFAIPYRPSANNKKCTGESLGEWSHAGKCFNGKATKITFNLTGTLPNTAIITVSYNTSDYGAEPQRPKACNAFTPQRCPYDSLNVGVNDGFPEDGEAARVPSTGTLPLPEEAYTNGTLESGWGGFQPLFEVKAN